MIIYTKIQESKSFIYFFMYGNNGLEIFRSDICPVQILPLTHNLNRVKQSKMKFYGYFANSTNRNFANSTNQNFPNSIRNLNNGGDDDDVFGVGEVDNIFA